jgi:hypothetical protein
MALPPSSTGLQLCKLFKLPDHILYRSTRVDLHGRGSSQQGFDNAKILQDGVPFPWPLAIRIVGPCYDPSQGRAGRHAVDQRMKLAGPGQVPLAFPDRRCDAMRD